MGHTPVDTLRIKQLDIDEEKKTIFITVTGRADRHTVSAVMDTALFMMSHQVQKPERWKCTIQRAPGAPLYHAARMLSNV